MCVCVCVCVCVDEILVSVYIIYYLYAYICSGLGPGYITRILRVQILLVLLQFINCSYN